MEPGTVAHASNSRAWKTQDTCSLRLAWATESSLLACATGQDFIKTQTNKNPKHRFY